MFKFSKIFRNREEKLDPQPHSAKVNFNRPLSLEERVARAVRAEMMNQRKQVEEVGGFDDEEKPEFESEHELVYDEVTGSEMTKAQKREFDESRKTFDNYVAKAKADAAKKKKEKKQSVVIKEEAEDTEPLVEADR